VPAAGNPTFQLADDEMEMGVGIHGEPGRRRVKLEPARVIAAEIVEAILGDLGKSAKGSAIVLVNGFGGTPAMELYLMYENAAAIISQHGVKIARSMVGNYVTSLEMAGCSITVTMADRQMLALWDAPVRTSALQRT
jgi:dihydroxyacetone kinase-like protein